MADRDLEAPPGHERGRPLAGAPVAAVARARSPRWSVPLTLGVWLLNAGLATAAVFALLNWSAFTWIVGSAAWATVLEIACVLCMLYLLCGGCCLLGWESRLRDSYLQLHHHKHCRLLTTLALPFMIGMVFLTLALLALVPFSGSNAYVMIHSSEVFAKADSSGDSLLSYEEFSNYTLSLSSFQDESNSTVFAQEMQATFVAMDTDQDGYISKTDLYEGTLAQLTPMRRRFGLCAAAIALVSFLFAGVYACWYRRLESDAIEKEPDEVVQFADRDDSDDESHLLPPTSEGEGGGGGGESGGDDDDDRRVAARARQLRQSAARAPQRPEESGSDDDDDRVEGLDDGEHGPYGSD